MVMDRLEELRLKLGASVDADGKPKAGYRLRVAMLEAEIERLETARAATPKNPAESSSGT
jgi:hypothetical protein